MDVNTFLAQLQTVPWFSSIGQPTPADSNVQRIYAWNEWPGPEDPSITELSLRQQRLYDSILEHSGNERSALSSLWDRIHAIVFRDAAKHVPYDPEKDSWHRPTRAVWQAAWTAGLVGLCLQTGNPIPEELQAQWAWFLQGHWPSGYSSCDEDGSLGPLLIY